MTEKLTCPICNNIFFPGSSISEGNFSYLRCAYCRSEKINIIDHVKIHEWFLIQQEKYYHSIDYTPSPLGNELENEEVAFRINKVTKLLSKQSTVCEVGPSGRFCKSYKKVVIE